MRPYLYASVVPNRLREREMHSNMIAGFGFKAFGLVGEVGLPKNPIRPGFGLRSGLGWAGVRSLDQESGWQELQKRTQTLFGYRGLPQVFHARVFLACLGNHFCPGKGCCNRRPWLMLENM